MRVPLPARSGTRQGASAPDHGGYPWSIKFQRWGGCDELLLELP